MSSSNVRRPSTCTRVWWVAGPQKASEDVNQRPDIGSAPKMLVRQFEVENDPHFTGTTLGCDFPATSARINQVHWEKMYEFMTPAEAPPGVTVRRSGSGIVKALVGTPSSPS